MLRPLPLALPAPPRLLLLPAPAAPSPAAESPPVATAETHPIAFEADFHGSEWSPYPETPLEVMDPASPATSAIRPVAAVTVTSPAARVAEPPAPRAAPRLELDPWAIMPARTLRSAGHRHLVHQRDPEEPAEGLLARAQRAPGAPPAASAEGEARHDLLILPARDGFRASDQGLKSLLLYLDRSQLLRAPQLSSLEEFVGHPGQVHAEDAWRSRLLGGPDREGQLVALTPGTFAHQLFLEGSAPPGPPVILRALIGHRPAPGPVPFGPPGLLAAFWVALVGCRFPRVGDAVLARLHDILHLRPRQLAVPHADPD